MINPTLNPLAASLIAANTAVIVAATPAAQAVTPRPATPPGKSEGGRARDRRDSEEEQKAKQARGERGASTNLVV
jgi:hypothetical protein